MGRRRKLGPLLGADRLDATVVEFDPGEGSEPYHYVYGREEWLLVLAGTPTLRHPQGDDRLEAGDLVCFPEGPAGAHRLLNRGESVVHALILSTTGLPANVCYPDTGHWLIRNGLGPDVVAREAGPLRSEHGLSSHDPDAQRHIGGAEEDAQIPGVSGRHAPRIRPSEN